MVFFIWFMSKLVCEMVGDEEVFFARLVGRHGCELAGWTDKKDKFLEDDSVCLF